MSALAQCMAETAADPLHHARAHAERGGRVIGIVGAEVPVELVLAAGALPIVLPTFADQPTHAAERYLEPSFAPALRSITEQWLQGRLDFMDAVVFSRGDDSTQRCYYYLCELQRRALARGPRPLIFDVAKIPRPSSLVHTLSSVRDLAKALASDAERIAAAILARDHRRALLAQLERLRRSACAPSGFACERLLRLADAVPAERLNRELAIWLTTGFAEHRGPRLLLTGTSPPDGRLHEAVERAGGCIVAELDDQGLDRIGSAIGASPDPLTAIAQHYHTLEHGGRSFDPRPARILKRAHDCAADGVVSWLIEEDEASAWQLPAVAAALEQARLPLLSLTRRRWDARDGALVEITQFTHRLSIRR
jgi:benzoyl-CoA reductase/2-hydroxyglutaryl-CoA dehydratase subunit BcrC/BadD/HgdB